MPNYEELYAALTPLQKSLKDTVNMAVKQQKTLAKNVDTGNLTEAAKNLATMAEAAGQLAAQVESLKAEIGAFDVGEYFSGGDVAFHRLVKLFDAPAAERTGDHSADKHRRSRYADDDAQCSDRACHRAFLIGDHASAGIADQQRQEVGEHGTDHFAFMNELAEAYELSCLKANVRIGSTQALSKIYKFLAPTARARKDYDTQAYAFDLARLYEAGPDSWVTKNGARYTFGTSRDGKNAIRVLSRTGVESFISTLRLLGEDGA